MKNSSVLVDCTVVAMFLQVFVYEGIVNWQGREAKEQDVGNELKRAGYGGREQFQFLELSF